MSLKRQIKNDIKKILTDAGLEGPHRCRVLNGLVNYTYQKAIAPQSVKTITPQDWKVSNEYTSIYKSPFPVD